MLHSWFVLAVPPGWVSFVVDDDGCIVLVGMGCLTKLVGMDRPTIKASKPSIYPPRAICRICCIMASSSVDKIETVLLLRAARLLFLFDRIVIFGE